MKIEDQGIQGRACTDSPTKNEISDFTGAISRRVSLHRVASSGRSLQDFS